MQTLETLPATTLYFKEGSSDKVYQCSIEPAGSRFVVNFCYGRRGSTMNSGTKTNVPVDFDAAKRIYDKLVKEKQAKGYAGGESATPYQHSDKQASGILPQLLNSISEAEARELLKDDRFCLQEKFDGKRLLIQKTMDGVHGINKKGLVVGLPETLIKAVNLIPGLFVLDGEAVGDKLHAFDLLEVDGRDMRNYAYNDRLIALINLLFQAQQRSVLLPDTAYFPAQKAILYKSLLARRAEGVVFKRLDAGYQSGRPNTGGAQLKCKFCATLSAVVAKVNQQRSVELRLLGNDGWQTCGNVTIPANHNIPSTGQVVEVRYLYAFRESGVLFQPVYLGVREDVDDAECLASQLKFKADEE